MHKRSTKPSIAIVMGGTSAERAISLQSGQMVKDHLCPETYKTQLVSIDADGWFALMDGEKVLLNKADFSCRHKEETIQFDAVFMALHGPPGEDGQLQAYFDLLGLPYSCSGQLESATTFHKGWCNTLLGQWGHNVAKHTLLAATDKINTANIIATCGLPCFVKPNQAGSSYGISKVALQEDLPQAIVEARKYDSEVLIETCLIGTEVSCGVTDLNKQVKALPVTEILPDGEFFDFEAKYKGTSKEITPARIGKDTALKVQADAEKAYRLLNLKGVARMDYIIQNGEPYLIEVNTVPGLSAQSIIPQQVRASGSSLADFFGQLVAHCLR